VNGHDLVGRQVAEALGEATDRDAATVPRQGEDPLKRPAPGHEILPHAADCIIEAWGPDRVSCLSEALRGLVELFAEVRDAGRTSVVPLAAGPGTAEDVLVSLLEDVIYSLDVFSYVPVRFHLAEKDDGTIAGQMEVVGIDQVAIVGPAPKAVSYHGLSMGKQEGCWRCHVLIDV